VGLLRGGRGWGRGKEGGGYVDKAAGADLVDLRVVREGGDENYVPSMRLRLQILGSSMGLLKSCCVSLSAALRPTSGPRNGSGVGMSPLL